MSKMALYSLILLVFQFDKMVNVMSNVKFSFKNFDKMHSLDQRLHWSMWCRYHLYSNYFASNRFTDNKTGIEINDWIKLYVEKCLNNFSWFDCITNSIMKLQSINLNPNLKGNKTIFCDQKERNFRWNR